MSKYKSIKKYKLKKRYCQIKENEMAFSNSKLKINGFKTFSEFVRALIYGNTLFAKKTSK